MDPKKEDLITIILNNYPKARPGFIEVVVDAIELHAKKNHDYNGDKEENKLDVLGVTGKFCDIWRKVSRLYHVIMEKSIPMVDESVEDTAIDLGVYAFLMVEKIKEERLKK